MIPTCPWPECGKPATGTLQVTYQESYIEEAEDTEAGWDYTGTTEDFDGPLEVEDGVGMPVFICGEGHYFTEAPRCIPDEIMPQLAARALTA